MNRSSEQGSAIIWILVALATFAALNYAFNSSNRTSTALLTDEEAQAYANQIIAFGNDVKASVKRLQLRGCDETEISFENSVVSGYANSNAPSNNRCHVFDVAGGGLTWTAFDEENWMMKGFDPNIADHYIAGSDQVQDIGENCADASCTELILTSFGLKKEICMQINDFFNIPNPADDAPEDDLTGSPSFAGAYSYNAAYILGDTTAELSGTKSGCYKDLPCTEPACYAYYNVLIAR